MFTSSSSDIGPTPATATQFRSGSEKHKTEMENGNEMVLLSLAQRFELLSHATLTSRCASGLRKPGEKFGVLEADFDPLRGNGEEKGQGN